MSQTIALKGEPDFLKITEGSTIYYGGDQAWFEFTIGVCGGCGTVAAANIMAYMAFARNNLRRLYSQEGLSKEQFATHMRQLYEYVKPHKIPLVPKDVKKWGKFGWTFGVWPSFHLIYGLKQYASEKAIYLTAVKKHNNRDKNDMIAYIKEGLSRDCPIAMLIGRDSKMNQTEVRQPNGRSWIQTSFGYHWVVITEIQIEENEKTGAEDVRLKVSTWGGFSYLRLADYMAGGRWPQVLVYFEAD